MMRASGTWFHEQADGAEAQPAEEQALDDTVRRLAQAVSSCTAAVRRKVVVR